MKVLKILKENEAWDESMEYKYSVANLEDSLTYLGLRYLGLSLILTNRTEYGYLRDYFSY